MRSLLSSAAPRVWAGAALALLAGPLSGQSRPAERTLMEPQAEFDQPLDQVIALRELPGGTVMVTDVGARSVFLLDFKTGEQTPVGRNGQGPGEYQFPGALLGAGDTTFLVDRASRRLLLVGPDGKMTGKTVAFPEAIGGMPDARGVDREGRVYFQASPFRSPGNDDESAIGELPDSASLLRWDRARNRVDSVAKVKVPAMKMNVAGGQNSRMVMMRPQPYTPEDDWSVGFDGQVAIARVGDYHVEWLGEGRRVAGGPVAYEQRRVADADKDRFMTALRTSRNRITITRGSGGRGTRELRPPEPNVDEFAWPDFLPPFRGRAMFVAPEGEAWVTRQPAGNDTIPTYDVFDTQGQLASRVHLPPGRRLVGLGRGVLYAVRTDQDGLDWLERYSR